MKNYIYKLMWSLLIRKYACPNKIEGIAIKGLGDVKHLSVIDGDLIIVVDGANVV